MKHTINIYINCPYNEKDECKQLGARWDIDSANGTYLLV